MPYASKELQRAAQHRHYEAHKAQYQARTRAWKAAHREAVRNQRLRANARKKEKSEMLIQVQQFGENWYEEAKQTIINGGTLTNNKQLQDMFWEKLQNVIHNKYPTMSDATEAEKQKQYRLTHTNKKRGERMLQQTPEAKTLTDYPNEKM